MLRNYAEHWQTYHTHANAKSRGGHEVSSKSSTVAFWMDTLCIPNADPAKPHGPQLEAKRMAIERMNSIYAGAAATAVLDAELEQMRLPTK